MRSAIERNMNERFDSLSKDNCLDKKNGVMSIGNECIYTYPSESTVLDTGHVHQNNDALLEPTECYSGRFLPAIDECQHISIPRS